MAGSDLIVLAPFAGSKPRGSLGEFRVRKGRSMLREISRKLDKIEQSIIEKSQQIQIAKCNCRGIGKKIVTTTFHNAKELELIRAVPCPVHGKRSLGYMMYAAKWMPIQKPDWRFCKCPPYPRRDALMGRIPLPTDPVQRRARLEELEQPRILDAESSASAGTTKRTDGEWKR